MIEVAKETAYYVNPRLSCVALIAKGLRFPSGTWIRIADASLPAWRVEELVPELFAGLRDQSVPFVNLLTDFDMQEFESALPTSG